LARLKDHPQSFLLDFLSQSLARLWVGNDEAQGLVLVLDSDLALFVFLLQDSFDFSKFVGIKT